MPLALTLSNDESAIVGCVVALVLSGIVTFLSYEFGAAGRNSRRQSELPEDAKQQHVDRKGLTSHIH